MANMRTFFAIFVLKFVVNAEVTADGQMWTHKDTGPGGTKDNRHVISPRMDFDEWTPLGRGDPLKNDPTFDYLPPVLDKVHYWKPPPSQAVASRTHSSTVAAMPAQAVGYNRRFFLTDFSKREPAAMATHVQYTYQKRPVAVQTVPVVGYRYQMPKTPLPMLTPPPYQRPTSVFTTTVEPTDVSPSLDAGDSAAESKQPPAAVMAAPPSPPPRSPTPQSASIQRPVLSHSVIKVLLENEFDRKVAATAAAMAATAGMGSDTGTGTSPVSAVTPPAADPVLSPYKQAAAVSRPMYLIIQGHSKVKTYGSAAANSKPDDLSAAQSPAAEQEHNHIGHQPPDEPSRRKRDGPQ